MAYTANKKSTDLEAKTTPVDADVAILGDSADSGRAKQVTIANLKSSVLESSNSLFRQAIINGNFDVWQRGTSFTTGGAVYTADRWKSSGAAGETISRSTDVPDGSIYSLNLVNTGGNAWIYQFIESNTAKFFVGKSITISFWMKSSLTTSQIQIQYADAADDFSALTSIDIENLTTSSTWQKFSFTFDSLPANTANGLAIRIISSPGAGGAADANIAQVQLNAGSVALPFQPKSFAEELRDCQRYYEKLVYGAAFPSDTYTAALRARNYGVDSTAQETSINIPFKVTKRIVPSVTNAIRYDINDGTATTANANTANQYNFMFAIGVTGQQNLDIHDFEANAEL